MSWSQLLQPLRSVRPQNDAVWSLAGILDVGHSNLLMNANMEGVYASAANTGAGHHCPQQPDMGMISHIHDYILSLLKLWEICGC